MKFMNTLRTLYQTFPRLLFPNLPHTQLTPCYITSRNFKDRCEPVKRTCQKKCEREIMDPKNKVCLVTGGTSGIGLAAANELLRSGACHVILTGIDPCAGKEAKECLNANYGSKKCTYMHLNVISTRDFKEAFKYAEKHFGGVDILFNNAGILEDKKWELEVETNLKATIRANLIGLKYMGECAHSTPRIIINNSDVCALEALPPAPIYTATKYGVLGVTRCFGARYHFKKTGVRVVALCSGATKTQLVKESSRKQLTKKWGKDTYNFITGKPLQSASVVGRAVVYLVRFAKSNSIWTVENSLLYRSEIPKKDSYNFMVSTL